MSLCSLPVVEEFLLVECRPLDDKARCTRRETTGEDGQVANIDQSDVPGILRMEMWGIMMVEEHLDDDPKEAADLRHGRSRGVGRGIPPPVVFRSP